MLQFVFMLWILQFLQVGLTELILKSSVIDSVISFKISQVFSTFAKALMLSNKTAGALTNAYNFTFKSLNLLEPTGYVRHQQV